MSNEQREAPRVNTTMETIYYTEDNHDGRVHYPGKIINVSKGGIGMIVNYPHQLNDQIWLEGIEESNSSPVAGKIQWINGDNGEYLLGVKLIH